MKPAGTNIKNGMRVHTNPRELIALTDTSQEYSSVYKLSTKRSVLWCFSKCEKVPIFNRGSRNPRETPAKSYKNIFQFMVDPRNPREIIFWKNDCVTDPRTPREMFFWKNDCVTDERNPSEMFFSKNFAILKNWTFWLLTCLKNFLWELRIHFRYFKHSPIFRQYNARYQKVIWRLNQNISKKSLGGGILPPPKTG